LYDIVWYIYIILLLYPNALGIPFFTNLGISGFEGPNWFWSLLVIYNYIYIAIPSISHHPIPMESPLYPSYISSRKAPHELHIKVACKRLDAEILSEQILSELMTESERIRP
jgi:hypothetical protein